MKMDTMSKDARSGVMRAVRGEGTSLEARVAAALESLGYRVRRNDANLPGRPDAVLVGKMAAVFAHGCFWHAHGCGKGKAPKSNEGYWDPKLRRNRERDAEAEALLKARGFAVAVVWECEAEAAGENLAGLLEQRIKEAKGGRC